MPVGENKIIRIIKRRRPRVVVIGGGTGLPVILNALKKQNAEITAIVTVSDDGGSSGVIRNYINVVPPGDMRNVLVSLSDLPEEEKAIFQYRFESNDAFFSGHSSGNLIIAALSEMRGNIFDAIQSLSGMMKVDGVVSTREDLHGAFGSTPRVSSISSKPLAPNQPSTSGISPGISSM